MSFFSRFLAPEVDRHLLVDQGEFIIDEVAKHWVTVVLPALGIIGCAVIFWIMPWLGTFWWVALVLGLVLFGYCMLLIHMQFMDRFVITNMRVFRVHGVLDQHLATMPMTRILDISVSQPLLGRLLGFGHFVFESAAQDQGLRDITFVARPEQRDLTIQRVITRAGLRAQLKAAEFDDELDFEDDYDDEYDD
ncbi:MULTISPECIES: PH domain-containing protein [unclassified Luteococcus]|uniref:PH domain-containing protein n=1 Tax=unclassified Luteococcus TaxID=2639923 RepID=UPI00313C00FE